MSETVKRNSNVVELATKGDTPGWKEFFYGQGNEQKIYVTKTWANADNTDDLAWTVPESGLYMVKYTFSSLGESGLGAFAERALGYRKFSAMLRRGGTDSAMAVTGVNDNQAVKEVAEELFFMYPLKAGDFLYPQVWTDKAGIKIYVRFFAAKITI